jgi:hypothetical protein
MLGALAYAFAFVHPAFAGMSVSRVDLVARLDYVGSKRTVDELWDQNRWGSVVDQISTGQADWVALAPRLATGTDAGTSETLGIALALALPRNPAAVLAALDLQGGPVLGPSIVCGVPLIDESPRFVANYRRRARAALNKVQSAALQSAKRACGAALK